MFEQKSLLKFILLHLIALVLVILNLSNLKIGHYAKLVPFFDVAMIFYFTIFKRVFGIWFVFLLGVWSDALNGQLLGVTSLCYILLIKIFLVLNSKMMIRDNFAQIWQQFIAFCFSFLLIKWMILSFFAESFLSVKALIVQFMISSVLYIIMHSFFDYLSVKLLKGR